uniref:Auxin efflux carrier component n=1 Tax=Fagus sylvatica TaxID=28930 RepID=A0A2N9F174_FAGSY
MRSGCGRRQIAEPPKIMCSVSCSILSSNSLQWTENLRAVSPSLILSKLADTITLDSLENLWFMPVNILLTFIIGSALAWILIKITRAPQHLRSLIIGSCAAAVCDEDNSPFGDSSVCSTDGESYAVLSMAIVGFIIALVSPFRKVLIGDDAPLRAIYSSVSLIGNAAIPSMTLIIGANLLRVKAAKHFGLVGSDSLYQFTLMIQYALPPAMNVGTISQLLKTGESECSVIMLWTYVVAAFSLTLWSTIFMWLVA